MIVIIRTWRRRLYFRWLKTKMRLLRRFDPATKARRARGAFLNDWHAAVVRYHDALWQAVLTANKNVAPRDLWSQHPHHGWMYEARDASVGVERMRQQFASERRAQLPTVLQRCSLSQPEPVADNHLRCCLGVDCRDCPHLKALERIHDATPEQVDEVKAWTCLTHILVSGGDQAKEGYLLSMDDVMFWRNLHENLAGGAGEEETEA